MLSRILLSSFKPFATLQDAPLAPITLVYGPNSCGKSSLIQSLLLLKQTLEGNQTRPLGLVPRGEHVDLGSFRQLLHAHDVSRELDIGLTFTEPAPFLAAGVLPKVQIRLTFALESSDGGTSPGRPVLTRIRYRTSEGPDARRVDWTCHRMVAEDGQHAHWPTYRLEGADIPDFLEDQASRHGRQGHTEGGFGLSGLVPRGPDRSALEEALTRDLLVARGLLPGDWLDVARDEAIWRQVDREGLVEALRGWNAGLARHLQAIDYLGPLRHAPERFYQVTGADETNLGSRGERAASVLHHRPEVAARINAWFRRFEIPYDLQIRPLTDDLAGDMVLLALTDHRSGASVGPADVGFGIGQLLPILVEGLASAGRTICVEQPEIHLHPRMQAHLGDFMIETAGLRPLRDRPDRTGPEQPLNAWIVETHSEALILRLQRRIREGAIAPDDVSVLYVDPVEGHGSVIRQLRLDSRGEFLDRWPHGFFEETYQEVFGGGR
jgi:hypothetical protein